MSMKLSDACVRRKGAGGGTVAAAAINVYRLSDWFGGIPRAATRTSRFARLAA
jgi:hypothetical protein